MQTLPNVNQDQIKFLLKIVFSLVEKVIASCKFFALFKTFQLTSSRDDLFKSSSRRLSELGLNRSKQVQKKPPCGDTKSVHSLSVQTGKRRRSAAQTAV